MAGLMTEKEIATEEQKEHLLNIIGSFLEVFGDDEYIIFHNEFMLTLLRRKGLLNVLIND